ncbi:hypothetical protein NDU88_001190 [Pleurodeles waltl]|uniref:Uncharacterized protein n=1 Tax=Pleurodeles waltl TaxID=8319 RepID=A0AAV7SYJ9_PLEWA|nr:hypothetical protein NDU88_001190 [Pleurodeles waltl]
MVQSIVVTLVGTIPVADNPGESEAQGISTALMRSAAAGGIAQNFDSDMASAGGSAQQDLVAKLASVLLWLSEVGMLFRTTGSSMAGVGESDVLERVRRLVDHLGNAKSSEGSQVVTELRLTGGAREPPPLPVQPWQGIRRSRLRGFRHR